MTDTGRIPGEGQPGNAGGQHGQPDTPAPGEYLAADPAGSVHGGVQDDLLLMPGVQGAWTESSAQPVPPTPPQTRLPEAHETDGRDSGSLDFGAVRTPSAAPAQPPATPRRPLHLGPPVPEQSQAVRSLADRGPTSAAPARSAAPAHPPQQASQPEYLDATPEPADRSPSTVPAGATAHAGESLPGPQLGELPPQPGGWDTPQPPSAPADEAEPVPAGPGPVEPGSGTAEGDASSPSEQPSVPDGTQPAPWGPDTAAPQEPVAGAEPGQPGTPAEAEAVPQEQAPLPTEAVQHAAPAADAVDASLQAPQGADPSPVTEPAGQQQPVAVPPATEAEADVVGGVESADPVATGQPAADPAPSGEVPLPETPVSGAPAEPVVPEAVAAEDATSEAVNPEPLDVPQPAQADALPADDAQAQPGQPLQSEEPVQPEEPVQSEQPVQEAAEVTEEATAAEVAPLDTPATPATSAPVAEGEAGTEAGAPPEAPEPAQPGSLPTEPLPAEPEPAAPAQASPAPAEQSPQAPVAGQPAPQAPRPGGSTSAFLDEPAPQVWHAPDDAPAAPADPGGWPDAGQVPGPAADAVPTPRAEVTGLHPVGEPVAAHAAPGRPHPEPASAQSADVLSGTPGHPEQSHPEQALPGQAHPAGAVALAEGEAVPAPHAAPDGRPTPGGQSVPAPRAGDDPRPAAGHGDDETADAHQAAGDGQAPPAPRPAPTGPPAPGYSEADREALHRVMRERRDIRNGFRPDPIPHEVLLRVLEAAHTAPSVGHSQPWDFVIIRSEDTRRAMHELATRQREAYAKSLPKARAKQFRELKIEAILDTPVNIVVTADPTRGGRHTLGRHTQPQMAPYSSALAVENLWLAARAEGLGVGWVSFFDEREMVRELDLPDHLEVVAYLCVGYVDAFPDEPELVQSGWSKRRPLSWVVHEESYGRRVLPGSQPHDLLSETLEGIRPLDAKALGEAWERQKRMTKPSGALGMLEIISAQLCGLSRKCPPPIPEPAAVAIFAGDHGVHAQGVTAWPQEVTAQMVANFLGGGAVCNAFANQVGAEVCVVDVGVAGDLPSTPGLLPRKVRAGTADFTAGPALTREEALRAVEVGIETARDLVTAGNKVLLTGEMGIANTTVSAALISVFTGADAAEVTGRGTGVNDEMHARKIEVVRRALELHRPDPADPLGVLAAVGGLEHAALVGLILGGASLRTPVILDGVSAGAAALVARAIAPEALAACIAGHRSAEPGHMAALTKLGLRPLVDLDLRLGEGTGALLALPVVQSAARAMHEVATFDAAGVTEKN